MKWLLNLFRTPKSSASSKASPARRPTPVRPQLEALEDRQMMSASATSTVPISGTYLSEFFEIDSQHHLKYAVSNGSEWQSVPGTEKWQAWRVKAVQDTKGDVNVFVNGTNGHLWEITHRVNGSWSGWTDMRKNFVRFDVAADARGSVHVVGIERTNLEFTSEKDVLYQTTRNAAGRWSGYYASGGYTYRFRDVAVAVNSKSDVFVFGVGLDDHHVWACHEPAGKNVYKWRNLGGNFTSVDPDYFASRSTILAGRGETVYGNQLNVHGNWIGWSK